MQYFIMSFIRSTTIADTLREAAVKARVKVLCNVRVSDIQHTGTDKKSFQVTAVSRKKGSDGPQQEVMQCDRVILATGSAR